MSLSSEFTSDPAECFTQAVVIDCSNTGPRTDLCSLLTVEAATGDYIFSASAADISTIPAGDYVTTIIVSIGGLTAASSFTQTFIHPCENLALTSIDAPATLNSYHILTYNIG